MDIATMAGIVIGIVCIVYSIILGGSIWDFFDISSVFIVFGGTFAATLISYRLTELAKFVKVAIQAFIGKPLSYENTIKQLIDLSQKARRNGLLSLEEDEDLINDDFLKQSLQLVIDGAEPEVIADAMDLEIENMKARHEKGQGLFKTLSAQFPSWGMIGTLIGLVQLLKALDDPSKIGPSMAVALITTFYGSVMANFVCNPIVNKLSLKSKEEIKQKKMIIEGILSIQAGENPRIMEVKLKSFLSPEQKLSYIQNSNGKSDEVDREERSMA